MVLLILALAWLSIEVGHRVIFYELHAPVSVDASLYLAMGRALLNGLVPYRDLFETKPPGMYLVAALSLVMGGDARFAMLLQIAVILLIPVLLGAHAFRQLGHCRSERRWAFVCLAMLFGLGWSVYVMERAGRFQTESFGAVAGVAYLVIITWNLQKPTVRRVVLAGLMLLVAVSFKEPFLFTMIAGFLLLADGRRQALWWLAAPLTIAGGTGLLVLLATGWLHPYAGIYLPEILHGRILEGHQFVLPSGGVLSAPQPAWLRGLQVKVVIDDVVRFGGVGLLGATTWLFWLVNPAVRNPAARPWAILVSAGTVVWGIVVVHQLFLLLQTLAILEYRIPWEDGFFRRLVARDVASILLLLGLLIGLGRWNRWQAIDATGVLVALYLVTCAAGLGGFLLHHYVFIVPAYAAGWMALVASAAAHRVPRLTTACAGLVALAACGLAVQLGREDYDKKLAWERDGMRNTIDNMALAPQLDELMDACGWDRYLPLGTDIYAATRHSPLEISWSQIRAFADPPSAYFREHFWASLQETPIVVVNEQAQGMNLQSIREPGMQRYLATEFTKDVPTCAAPYVPLGSLRILFRE